VQKLPTALIEIRRLDDLSSRIRDLEECVDQMKVMIDSLWKLEKTFKERAAKLTNRSYQPHD
jgi:hypothetical protein